MRAAGLAVFVKGILAYAQDSGILGVKKSRSLTHNITKVLYTRY